MPSVSNRQHVFMEAIAHSPEFAAKAGVPQKVGKDFAKADDRAGITKAPSKPTPRDHHMARKTRHSTHAEVAADFGVSRPTVSRAVKRVGFVKGGSAR
jgi:hypothetical protein